MILPIGLGKWPAKIPFALLLLSVAIITFSFIKFSDLAKLETHTKKNEKTEKIKTLSEEIVMEDCQLKKRDFGCYLLEKMDFKVKVSRKEKKHLRKYLEPFQREYKKWPEHIRKTEKFSLLMEKAQRIKQARAQKLTELQFLTKENINILTIISANFSHSNFTHLAGNLLFLLVFGMHLELALGSTLFLLTFMLGGYSGIIAEVFMMSENYIHLLGASAGVSAVIGSYLVTFWKAQMRFLFFPFKSFYLPVAWSLPLFYFVNDFAGAMFRNLQNSNVAHLAHLTGFVVGVTSAILIKYKQSIKWPFLFEKEEISYENAINSKSHADKLHHLLIVYKWNPQNTEACLFALNTNAENQVSLSKTAYLDLSYWSNMCLTHLYKSKNFDKLSELLSVGIDTINLNILLNDLPQSAILSFADRYLEKQELKSALKLYRYLLSLPDCILNKQQIHKTCQNIESFMLEKRSS